MNNYCNISCTTDSIIVANTIINELLNRKLIACGQVSEINSSYWWKDEIINSHEYLINMKSKKILYKDIEQVIKNNHNYEVCEIIVTDIVDGNKDYFDWIDNNTRHY